MMQRATSTAKSPMFGRDLSALVEALGMECEYEDGFGHLQCAPREAVLATLACLGYPVTSEASAREALEVRETQRMQRGLAPVNVAWAGSLDRLSMWSESRAPSGRWRVRVALEDGQVLLHGGSDTQTRRPSRDGRYVHSSLPCRLRLPAGTHQLEVEWGSQRAQTLVIAAPRRSPTGPRRSWGLFAPVYALRGQTQQGTGTLTELSDLCELLAKAGGDFVATLPMLAQFLDQPFDSSPFAPASRLFWNETLLDLSVLPELAQSIEVRALFHSDAFRARCAELERGRFVKPREQCALTHSVLTPLAQQFFARGGGKEPGFVSFLGQQPYVQEYARFRAVCDLHGAPEEWPEGLKRRALTDYDGSEARCAMHLYAQYQMHMQLSATAGRARERGVLLQLDLPLGVHRTSFDMWREPGCFVKGLSSGAPRDALCPEGQDWGFAPAHPDGQREQHYRYFRAYIRNQLRYAGILRIDHVMGLHRTFCVPDGMSPRDGLYLRQPQEELHALLALEATRSRSVLVGEDLGTVPDAVRHAMSEHGMKRMYVVPFELEHGDNQSTLRPMPKGAIASLNTHDLPTLAGLWQGQDIDERLARDVISPVEALEEREERQVLLTGLLDALGLSSVATRSEVLRAAVARLGKSEAELVLITLEDLWGESEPQNVPGTFAPERNFCRRMRHRLDDIPRQTQVRALLKLLDKARTEALSSSPSTVAST